MSVSVGVCVCVRARSRSRARMGLGLGLGVGQSLGLPEVCQGSPRLRHSCHLVSWKPNAEGLAGRAEATQVCSGSRGPGHPPAEGLGLRGPKSWDAAACEGHRPAGRYKQDGINYKLR